MTAPAHDEQSGPLSAEASAAPTGHVPAALVVDVNRVFLRHGLSVPLAEIADCLAALLYADAPS